MALITNNLDPAVPSTHAFVIGVGHYPHLKAGNEWDLDGDLDSAALSAARFIKWLLEDFNNPDAPLSTIEHLVSPCADVFDKAGVLQPSEAPVYENIETAYSRWIARAGANPENIAIFYFCGHGVSKGVGTALLVEDFAKPLAKFASRAINIGGTIDGMFACKANRQCFFIDACRTADFTSLQKSLESPGQALGAASSDDIRPVHQPTLFASGLTKEALSSAGGISVFTSALIDALNGMAADDEKGLFAAGQAPVLTDRMCLAINESISLSLLAKPWLGKPECRPGAGGNIKLHYPLTGIKVPLIVTCDPADYNINAAMSVSHPSGYLVNRNPLAPESWLSYHAPDRYDLSVTLPGGQSGQQPVLLSPPLRRVSFPFPLQPPAPPVVIPPAVLP